MPKDLANITFRYQPSAVRIINNGHTVQVNYDSGSYIEVDRKRYNLLQFHYHTPSEHAVNGKLFAAELHLVHEAGDGSLAVVGVMLQRGAESPALKAVWDVLPTTPGPEKVTGTKVNAAAMLPSDSTTYRYSGSLTTPPCTEGVTWLVMTTPIAIGEAQLEAFGHLFEGNNRPLQGGSGREVVVDTSK